MRTLPRLGLTAAALACVLPCAAASKLKLINLANNGIFTVVTDPMTSGTYRLNGARGSANLESDGFPLGSGDEVEVALSKGERIVGLRMRGRREVVLRFRDTNPNGISDKWVIEAEDPQFEVALKDGIAVIRDSPMGGMRAKDTSRAVLFNRSGKALTLALGGDASCTGTCGIYTLEGQPSGPAGPLNGSAFPLPAGKAARLEFAKGTVAFTLQPQGANFRITFQDTAQDAPRWYCENPLPDTFKVIIMGDQIFVEDK